MSIIVESSLSLPTPQTYSGLVTSIQNWLNRSDLEALIPDFIALAEERINRALRIRQMEQPLAETTIVDGAIGAPEGTLAIKAIWAVGFEQATLRSQSFDFVKSRGATGIPAFYAWQGENIYFDGAGSVAGVVYQRIPTLSENDPTNWLLSLAPSAYLFGALREAWDYIRNDAERDRWNARFEAVLSDLNATDNRDRFSHPLQVRVR